MVNFEYNTKGIKQMKQTIKNYLYNAAYNILNMLLPLITTPYLARVLGAEGVGIYAYYFAIAQFFSLIAKLGLTNYGTRCIAEVRGDIDKLKDVFSNVYAMQVGATLLISCIYYVGVFLFADKTYIALIFGIWLLSIIFDTDWFLFGLEDFRTAAIRNFAVKTFSTLAVFLIVHNVSDIWKYAFITSLSYAGGYIALWVKCKKFLSIGTIRLQKVIHHIAPCCVLLISVLALSIYRSMDKVMLGAISGMAETGLYEYAEKLVYCLTTLIASFGAVMLPKMSNLVSKKENKKGEKYLIASMIFVVGLTSSMTFGLFSISHSLIPILYGEKFNGSILLLNYLAITLIPIGWGNVIRSQYLIPHKKDKIYVGTICMGAVVNLAVNALLIPRLGAVGACIGTLCAEFSVQILQGFLSWKSVPYMKLFILCAPFLLIGIVMMLLLKCVECLGLAPLITMSLQVVLGAVVYLGLSALYFVYLKKTKKIF